MAAASSCPQCSALVEMPPDRLSTTCPYCRSPLVAATAEGTRPDVVAPFRLTREQAGFRLQQYLRARIWSPNSIRRKAAPGKLEGVLLPFWVHDGIARSTWRASLGLYYWRTVRRGNKTVRKRETEWFASEGSHVAAFQDHLVSASKGLPEKDANALEPFDLGQAKPFEAALVAGWIAELPTIRKEDAAVTAAVELREVERRAIARFVTADQVAGLENETTLEGVRVRLALLPAWLATYSHAGATLRLLVNGQTGEVVGKVPLSPGKMAAVALAAIGLAAVLVLLAVLAD